MERREFLRNISLALASAALPGGCAVNPAVDRPARLATGSGMAIPFVAASKSWLLPVHDGPTRWIADADCYVRFANNNTVARPARFMRFNAGEELFLLPPDRHLNVMAIQSDGTLQIEFLTAAIDGLYKMDTDRVLNYAYGGPTVQPAIATLPPDASQVRICVPHPVRCEFGTGTRPPTLLRQSERQVELLPGTHSLSVPAGSNRFAAINTSRPGRSLDELYGVLNLVCLEA